MERITKLDGARRHLDQAIRLFFEDRDPLVVHTLAAAAQGTLRDIARVNDSQFKSILHDHPDIPDDHRKDWVNALNAPRNFFKHADRDPQGVLEFDPSVNISTLLDAVLLCGSLSNEYLSAANVFMGWFTTKFPEMRNSISNNQIGEFAVHNGISPDDKAKFLELIDARILIGRA